MSCAAKKLLVATSLSCLILAAKRRLPADARNIIIILTDDTGPAMPK